MGDELGECEVKKTRWDLDSFIAAPQYPDITPAGSPLTEKMIVQAMRQIDVWDRRNTITEGRFAMTLFAMVWLYFILERSLTPAELIDPKWAFPACRFCGGVK